MEQNLVNIFKHMSEYLDDTQIGTILKDMSEYLDVAELAAVIEDVIPDDYDVPLSTKIFGTPEQIEFLLHIRGTVVNDSWCQVLDTDEKVMESQPGPALFNLILYKKWSQDWKEENPETKGTSFSESSRAPSQTPLSRSPNSREHSLPRRSHGDPGHSSRASSRPNSRAPSHGPQRSSHTALTERNKNLSDLLHQMKMICTTTTPTVHEYNVKNPMSWFVMYLST
jgi:hypothetical protein